MLKRKRAKPVPGRGRGRPRVLPDGAERVRICVPCHVIDAWRAAGRTDLHADIVRAFCDTYMPQQK